MKAILLGVVTGEGVSKKSGKDYDFAQIRVLRPAKGFKSETAEFHAAGFKEATAACTEQFFAAVEKMKIDPLNLKEVELIVESRFNDYDKLEAVVTGIK